jgi:hypothetical protein
MLLATVDALLLAGIPHVVELRSQEQMIWSHAGWIVAAMKYPEPFRDFTTQQAPRNPVRALTWAASLASEATIAR